MTGLRRRLIFGALFFAATPSIAAAATPVDWSGCAVPLIGVDKRAAISACAAILDRATIPMLNDFIHSATKNGMIADAIKHANLRGVRPGR
jgi:hypothetical protein